MINIFYIIGVLVTEGLLHILRELTVVSYDPFSWTLLLVSSDIFHYIMMVSKYLSVIIPQYLSLRYAKHWWSRFFPLLWSLSWIAVIFLLLAADSLSHDSEHALAWYAFFLGGAVFYTVLGSLAGIALYFIVTFIRKNKNPEKPV